LFELQVSTAVPYLTSRGFDPAALRIVELGGGVSNTVLLVESADRRFVLKQALGKLRVEQDWFSDRNRIFRESAALRWIRPRVQPGAVPEVLFEDRENGLFAMSAAPAGAQTWKSLLMSGVIDAGIAKGIGNMLATIVRASWGDAECERDFGDQTIFDQLRLDPYYRATARRHPRLAEHFERLMEESRGRRVSLVHGDWSPKNFLVSQNGLMAIDFEVVHFGDPSFDAAFLLNHLLLKSFYRPQCAAALSIAAREFWNAFCGALPDEAASWMEPATLRHLGCLLLARVDGKSPAEYLQAPDLKQCVRSFACQWIASPPGSIAAAFEQAGAALAGT
jgi:5-methylthioribose kinase